MKKRFTALVVMLCVLLFATTNMAHIRRAAVMDEYGYFNMDDLKKVDVYRDQQCTQKVKDVSYLTGVLVMGKSYRLVRYASDGLEYENYGYIRTDVKIPSNLEKMFPITGKAAKNVKLLSIDNNNGKTGPAKLKVLANIKAGEKMEFLGYGGGMLLVN